MSTIWKWEFPITDEFALDMPLGARIVHVDVQRGTPCLWAIVVPDDPKVERRFRVYGTGHPITGSSQWHVGSFQMLGGHLVWHLFEVDDRFELGEQA